MEPMDIETLKYRNRLT